MSHQCITPCRISAFASHLRALGRSPATIACYLRHVRAFAQWLDGRAVDRIAVQDWKTHLTDSGAAPSTVNSKLAALHSYCRFLGRSDCRVRYLRVQRQLFRPPGRELSQRDYLILVRTARRQRQQRRALILETIAACGLRISELRHITAQAVQDGRAEIHLKGKVRVILLPRRLRDKLQRYARTQKIAGGALFRTTGDRPISRQQVWREMKALARAAHIDPGKVFPHNLRHLFATVFYAHSHDIVRLADILGHSSVETTRRYLTTSGSEHIRQLDSLHLVT